MLNPLLPYMIKALEQPQVKTYAISDPDCKHRVEHYKKYALGQKFFQIKVVKDSIPYKKVSEHICLSPPPPPAEESYEALKIVGLEILKCTKLAKWILFRTRRCQKWSLYKKMLQIKFVKDSIS